MLEMVLLVLLVIPAFAEEEDTLAGLKKTASDLEAKLKKIRDDISLWDDHIAEWISERQEQTDEIISEWKYKIFRNDTETTKWSKMKNFVGDFVDEVKAIIDFTNTVEQAFSLDGIITLAKSISKTITIDLKACLTVSSAKICWDGSAIDFANDIQKLRNSTDIETALAAFKNLGNEGSIHLCGTMSYPGDPTGCIIVPKEKLNDVTLNLRDRIFSKSATGILSLGLSGGASLLPGVIREFASDLNDINVYVSCGITTPVGEITVSLFAEEIDIETNFNFTQFLDNQMRRNLIDDEILDALPDPPMTQEESGNDRDMEQMNHNHVDVMNQNYMDVDNHNSTEENEEMNDVYSKHWKDFEDTLTSIGLELSESRYLNDVEYEKDVIVGSIDETLEKLKELVKQIEETVAIHDAEEQAIGGQEFHELEVLEEKIEKDEQTLQDAEEQETLDWTLQDLKDSEEELKAAERAMEDAKNQETYWNDYSVEDTDRALEWGWSALKRAADKIREKARQAERHTKRVAERAFEVAKKKEDSIKRAIEREAEKIAKVAKQRENDIKRGIEKTEKAANEAKLRLERGFEKTKKTIQAKWEKIVADIRNSYDSWKNVWDQIGDSLKNITSNFVKFRNIMSIPQNIKLSNLNQDIIEYIPLDHMTASACGSVSVKFLKITMCGEQGFTRDDLKRMATLLQTFLNTLIQKANELFTLIRELMHVEGTHETWQDLQALRKFMKSLGEDIDLIAGDFTNFMNEFLENYKETVCIGVGNPNVHASMCLKRINPITPQEAVQEIVEETVKKIIESFKKEFKDGAKNFWKPSIMIEHIVDTLFQFFDLDSVWVESGVGMKDIGAIDFRLKATLSGEARDKFKKAVKRALGLNVNVGRYMELEEKLESDESTNIVEKQNGNYHQILYDV